MYITWRYQNSSYSYNRCFFVIDRCDSIGSTDMTVLAENLRQNTSLTSLSLAANQLSHPKQLMEHISAWIKVWNFVEIEFKSDKHIFENLFAGYMFVMFY